ncbi:MAG: large subunit ribosomal protein L29 [Flavobacteriales bacterium]|jgi:large subunit ribosomal protein L29
MKASVIKEMDIQDIAEAIKENEMTLTKKKISHKVAELENPIEIRNVRRTVARLKTELRKRELETSK